MNYHATVVKEIISVRNQSKLIKPYHYSLSKFKSNNLITIYPMKNQKFNSVLFAIIIVVLTIILNMKP